MKHSQKLFVTVSVGVISLFFVTTSASAQLLPRVPTTEPGRAEQRLQIEEPRPEVGVAPLITLPDETGQAKQLKDGVKFVLKGVTFEGATAVPVEQLSTEYQPLINREVTLATLNQIASKITVDYRNAGYILSRAVVPPQEIKNGVVVIRLVEGYVNKVTFEGKMTDPALLNGYGDHIRNAHPLDAATLERYLLLMEDLPGMKANAVIRPSDVPGASDVIVTISDKPFDALVTVDNRGTRYMGPVEGSVTVSANNAMGVYDRTQLRGEITAENDEMRFAQVVHDEQLDTEGTKLELTGGYTRTHPSYKLSEFDINGRDDILSADVSHPFIRSRQANWYGDVKFDARQTDTDGITGPLYNDKLRVLRVGSAYDFIDPLSAINRVQTQLSKGFDWGVGSIDDLRSRATGKPDFFKATAEASRLQPITGPFDLYVTATGQASSNTLLSAEQFGLGGDTYGSAYDPDEIVGDSGFGARSELQYNGLSGLPYLSSYQLYGFVDGGKLWSRNPALGQNFTASLVSTGFGARFNLLPQWSGSLEFAAPLTRRVAADGEDGYSPRVFFSTAYRY